MSKDFEKLEIRLKELQKHIEKMNSKASIWCSFCGKEKEDVKEMIRSPTPEINICNECIDIAYKLVHGDGE